MPARVPPVACAAGGSRDGLVALGEAQQWLHRPRLGVPAVRGEEAVPCNRDPRRVRRPAVALEGPGEAELVEIRRQCGVPARAAGLELGPG